MTKKIIGLTGGIGCGKTTVANIFRDKGVNVIDADKISHVISRPGSQVSKLVREKFPDAIIGDHVDRRKLGKIIFNDPVSRKLMTDLMRPHIEDAVACIQAHLPDELVVYDFPLLFEMGLHNQMPVIVVHVPLDMQIQRIRGRDVDLSIDDIRARISSQAPIEEKLKIATWTIDNSLGLQETEKQITAILKQLGFVRKEFPRGIG